MGTDILIKRLREGVTLCKEVSSPYHAEILLDDSGIICRMRNEKTEIGHKISWSHMASAGPGINPLIFGLAHCKRTLEALDAQDKTS